MSSSVYQEFAASKPAPRATTTRTSDSDPSEQIEVSVYLKPRGLSAGGSEAAITRETREQMKARRTREHQDDIRLLREFAAEKGLTVTVVDPARRLVKMSGSVSNLESAFRTSIGIYQEGAKEFRSHSGALQLPQDILPMVESILGIDNRELAEPHFIANLSPAAGTGYRPNKVAALYGFPPGRTAPGQCIGILEFGGGYYAADTAAAFAAMGLPTPTVVWVSVDGVQNNPGSPDVDLEVALDIQVAGGGAPGAKIAVYFAPNTDKGFADAITQAAQDSVNDPSVISISWGNAEDNWNAVGPQVMATINNALKDAAALGISVFVASGDDLSTDGDNNGMANVDFPSSSPWAIGCGGTTVATDRDLIGREVVWNDGTSGTGGGISDFFAVPSFQAAANLPPSMNDGKHRRGVPDVAGDAAPSSGYLLIYDNKQWQAGGTSAVAPLWAGLTALINQAATSSIGFFLPTLYRHPPLVRVITHGNNKPAGSNIGYDAGSGWSACTGLGVPMGSALLMGLAFPARPGSNLAAVQWMYDSGVELRVYYQDATNTIREYCYSGGQWRAGASLMEAVPGSALAAVQWMGRDGVQLRLYYQDTSNVIQEKVWNGTQWQSGAALGPAAPGSALAAVQWMSGNRVQVRLYYQDTSNAIQEKVWNGTQWQSGSTLVRAASGSRFAVVHWTSDSVNQLRVYYQAGTSIREYMWNGKQWSQGLYLGPATAPGSGLAAVRRMKGKQVELRVYYQDESNVIQEQVYGYNRWSSGVALGPAATGSAIAALEWTEGSGVELRVYNQNRRHALEELWYLDDQWIAGRFCVPTKS